MSTMLPEDTVTAGSRWLSTKDAAAYLGVAVSTLNNDRVTRLLGLPFSRVGRRVLYDRRELDAYLLARMEGGSRIQTQGKGV